MPRRSTLAKWFGLAASAAAVQLLLSGCNPFEGLATDETFSVPNGQGPSLELLIPDRRLPATATDIAGHVQHFQDTMLTVRFDAPLSDARKFQAAMLDGKGSLCSRWPSSKIADWPNELPKYANCLEDMTLDDEKPPIMIALIYRGERATVYVHTFSI